MQFGCNLFKSPGLKNGRKQLLFFMEYGFPSDTRSFEFLPDNMGNGGMLFWVFSADHREPVTKFVKLEDIWENLRLTEAVGQPNG